MAGIVRDSGDTYRRPFYWFVRYASAMACLAMAMIGLAGCGDWTMMTASLSNHSPQPITDISVDLAGVSRSIGKLEPGESATRRVFNGRSGQICLSFRQGGKLLQYGFGYLTHGAPIHHRIVIRERHIAVLDDSFGSSREVWTFPRPYPPGKKCRSHEI